MIKLLEREADHSPTSSSKVKNAWSLPPLPNILSWRGTQLKHRDNLTSYRRKEGIFFLHYRVQTGCRSHPASYLMDTDGSYPGGKAAGV
jgi:hypothetical protein